MNDTYNSLTLKQKVGQLFIVAGITINDHRDNTSQIKKLVKEYDVGGIMFLKGKVKRQAKLTNYCQSISKVPLFISIDANGVLI